VKIPPLPPIYLIVGLLTVFFMYSQLPTLNVMPEYLSVLGLGLIALGTMTALFAALTLRSRGTPVSFSPGSSLVVDGVFGRTRNPMYLALVAILAGAALFSGNVGALTVPAAAFAALALHLVPLEEAKLEKEFGKDYLDYKEQTRRWL